MNANSDLDIKLQRDYTNKDFRTKSTILDILILLTAIVSSTLIFHSFYVTLYLGKVIHHLLCAVSNRSVFSGYNLKCSVSQIKMIIKFCISTINQPFYVMFWQYWTIKKTIP